MITSCELVREALSAGIDDEEMPVAAAAVESHLRHCADCRDFGANAASVARRLRLRLIEPVPELADQILKSLAGEPPTPLITTAGGEHFMRRKHGFRLTQWAAAIIVLSVSAPALAFGAFTHPHVVPSHVRTPCTVSLVTRSQGTHGISSPDADKSRADDSLVTH
ncbi:MAG TPA: zf-HC2 domain-containing protein [Acidimicrobiales bacterium]|nr:zf-HC2 domain-containing protein [Acidimicrobiales bacterium]